MDEMERYLRHTPVFDSDSEPIKRKAEELTRGKEEVADKAKNLFYFVRDEIKYNFYAPPSHLEFYQASRTLQAENGFCIQKSILLDALARAIGIPARLHLADIRNHLLPEKIVALAGTNDIVFHGYSELYVEGKWVKVTPSFDLKMCQENRIIPSEFNGRSDAMLHSHNLEGKLHIEYTKDRGNYEELPFEEIRDTWFQVYGSDCFERWAAFSEMRGG